MFLRKKKEQLNYKSDKPDYFAILPPDILILISQYLADENLKNLIFFGLLNKNTRVASSYVANHFFPNHGTKSAQELMKEKQHQFEYTCKYNQITYDFNKYLKLLSSNFFDDCPIKNKEIIKKYLGKYKYLVEKPSDGFYRAALILFADYCKHQVYYLQGTEKAIRFFNGDWNHTHNEVVKRIMMKYDPSGWRGEPILSNNYNYTFFVSLLNDLKSELLKEGKVLKKNGELTKRIKFLQDISEHHIIDLVVLTDPERFENLRSQQYRMK